MVNCSKCNAEETDSYSHAKCDACELFLCLTCSGLSASEQKGVTVKKRSPSVRYNCKDCLQNMAVSTCNAELKMAVNDMAVSIKASIMRSIQKGFDDIKLQLSTVEKNSVERHKLLSKATGSIASLMSEERTKTEDMQVSFKNLVDTNKEVIKLYGAPQSGGNSRLQEEKQNNELTELRILYAEIKRNYELQQREISQLKAELVALKGHTKQNPINNSNSLEAPALKDLSATSTNALHCTIQSSKQAVPGTNIQNVTENQHCEIAAATLQPKSTVFVSKLAPGTKKESLMKHLQNKFGPSKPFHIEELKVQSEEFCSYKIQTEMSLQEDLLNLNNWPKGVTVKKFQFFRKNGNQSQYNRHRQYNRKH